MDKRNEDLSEHHRQLLTNKKPGSITPTSSDSGYNSETEEEEVIPYLRIKRTLVSFQKLCLNEKIHVSIGYSREIKKQDFIYLMCKECCCVNCLDAVSDYLIFGFYYRV